MCDVKGGVDREKGGMRERERRRRRRREGGREARDMRHGRASETGNKRWLRGERQKRGGVRGPSPRDILAITTHRGTKHITQQHAQSDTTKN